MAKKTLSPMSQNRVRLSLEVLEERLVPASDYLLQMSNVTKDVAIVSHQSHAVYNDGTKVDTIQVDQQVQERGWAFSAYDKADGGYGGSYSVIGTNTDSTLYSSRVIRPDGSGNSSLSVDSFSWGNSYASNYDVTGKGEASGSYASKSFQASDYSFSWGNTNKEGKQVVSTSDYSYSYVNFSGGTWFEGVDGAYIGNGYYGNQVANQSVYETLRLNPNGSGSSDSSIYSTTRLNVSSYTDIGTANGSWYSSNNRLNVVADSTSYNQSSWTASGAFSAYGQEFVSVASKTTGSDYYFDATDGSRGNGSYSKSVSYGSSDYSNVQVKENGSGSQSNSSYANVQSAQTARTHDQAKDGTYVDGMSTVNFRGSLSNYDYFSWNKNGQQTYSYSDSYLGGSTTGSTQLSGRGNMATLTATLPKASSHLYGFIGDPMDDLLGNPFPADLLLV